MNPRPDDAKLAIQAKVIELAKTLGKRDPRVGFSESIPDSKLLDSAGLMELMVWYEGRFGLSIPQEDLTLDNFATIDLMAGYAERARG
jgi:acyl carrier protein